MLLANYDKHLLLPEKDFAGFEPPAPTIPRSPGHHQEWIEARKTGKSCSADFQYSGWLTEANHLGNLAFRAGKKLVWNPKALQAENAPELERWVHREYRPGWTL